MLEERTERENTRQNPQSTQHLEAILTREAQTVEQREIGSEKAGTEKRQEAVRPGRPAPRPEEWLLSVVTVVAAYLYVSVFGAPTSLGRLIRRSYYWGNGYAFMGLFLLLFTGVFLTAGLGYAKKKGKKPAQGSWGYLALTIAAASWFPLCADYDQDIFWYMLLFLHGAAVYWLLVMSGNRSGTDLDERGLLDLGRGFFVLPFSGYLRIFSAWGNLFRHISLRKKRKESHGWQIFFGVGISVPVLVFVVPMLTAADDYFWQFTKAVEAGMRSFIGNWRFSVNGVAVFFTMLTACYLYGLFYNAFHKPAMCRETRFQAPQVIMGSFLTPFVLLYLVFFAVRLAGVAGAMEQIAGGDLQVSTYAREGFFELCRVAAVNLAVFILARWYSPEAKKGVRLLLGGLGIETLAFIGLAFSKMWYYIESYHSFTFKRALCCWLLITLFVLFALMVAELWQKKIKGIRIGVLFGCISFLMMAYSNMPAWAP